MGAFERNDLLFRNSVGVSDRLSVEFSKGRMGSELRRELGGKEYCRASFISDRRWLFQVKLYDLTGADGKNVSIS